MGALVNSYRDFHVLEACWLHLCSYELNIELILGDSDVSAVPILWHVSLIYSVKHSILSQSSATPMFLLFQYWIICQPDHWDQALNIESMFGHSDVSDVTILDSVSAWSMGSSIEYWVNLRPLRCFYCFNIEWHVSLTIGIRHWILSQCSATPMFPMFQYWMLCQPDPCGQALNIKSMFGHSDVSDVPILDAMSAWSMRSSIEY